MRWICSSSDDVVRHYLLRKEPQVELYDTIAVFTDKQQRYEDKTAASGQDYVYVIEAEDLSGYHSRQSSTYYHAEVAVTDKVKIKCREDSNGNHVSWTTETKRNVIEYVVLRAEVDDRMRIVARTRERHYLDTDIVMNKKYTYAIKILYSDGTESGVYK